MGLDAGHPLSHSACQHAIQSRQPLLIEDARSDPLVRDSPAVGELGSSPTSGSRCTAPAAHTIGTLCAIDTTPRAWTEEDVRVLQDLAATVTAYLEARPAPQQPARGSTSRPSPSGPGSAPTRSGSGSGATASSAPAARPAASAATTSATSPGWNGCATASRRASGSARRRRSWRRTTRAPSRRPPACATRSSRRSPRPTPGVWPSLVEQSFTLLRRRDGGRGDRRARAAADRRPLARRARSAIAEEHLLSEVVLARLRTLLGDRRPAVRGTAVLACAPGERHELGLLALAVLLQADGWLRSTSARTRRSRPRSRPRSGRTPICSA